jgi:hypothetical protein
MLRRSLLLLWRSLVLIAIAGLAYVTTFLIFPFIDDRTPLWVTFLLGYSILAYALIPLMIRLLRLIIKPNHIPTHVTTSDGWPSDPVNIALTVRNKRHLIRAMKRAGWYVADEGTLRNTIREGLSLLFDKSYPNAPCSRLYMFGRYQDIAFQIPVGNSPRTRHHVRFWRVDPVQTESSQHFFWWQTLKKMAGLKRELWVGAATFDKHMLGMRWRTLQLTHHIDADTHKERDFLLHTLENAQYVKHIQDIKSGEPYRFRGQNFGITIVNDGYTKLAELRRFAPHRTDERERDNTDAH